MSDFIELAKNRCSVRAYRDKPIEAEKLTKILEAGRLAPTGKNLQPQRLLVIQSEDGLKKLATVTHTPNAYTAKAAILVCTDTSDVWVRSFDDHSIHEIDASIVTTYMMLEATQLGIGSLWVERFEPSRVRELFSLPEHFSPDAILCLGYAEPEAIKSPERYATERKPLAETVWYETFD